MKASTIFKYLMICTVLFLLACGDGTSDRDADLEPTDGGSDVGTDGTDGNQVVVRDVFGRDGNLWKPSGDGHGASPGAVVIILSPKYNKEFDYCEFKTKAGQTQRAVCINNAPWTHRPYSCFANPSHGGDRQHWRTFTSCHDIGEVKATCYLGDTKYIFTAPDGQGAAVCTRFG